MSETLQQLENLAEKAAQSVVYSACRWDCGGSGYEDHESYIDHNNCFGFNCAIERGNYHKGDFMKKEDIMDYYRSEFSYLQDEEEELNKRYEAAQWDYNQYEQSLI